jgi:ribonuclease P protein component
MKMHTLKGRNQISAAFRRGKKFASSHIIVHVRSKQHVAEKDAPIGAASGVFVMCAVRKKQVPLAVTRNRIKRIVRECTRAYLKENPQVPFMTLAFVWQLPMQNHMEAKTQNIKPQVFDVLDQAKQYFSAKQSKESKT